MPKRMLIDASHPEETRVVVTDGARLDEFDVETSTKKQLKGNIYLAKVVRVEPSLQAAFVEYGGGRHGFLAFGEIHPDYYQIPVADRQRLLELEAEEAREAEAAEAAEDAAAEAAAPQAAAEAAAAPAADPDAAREDVPAAALDTASAADGPAAAETAAEEEAIPPFVPEAADPAPAADPADAAAADVPPERAAPETAIPETPAASADEPPAEPAPPRAQPLAIPVESVRAPEEPGASSAPALPPPDDAAPAPAAAEIIEVSPEPAPPPEQINAGAAETHEEEPAPRRIPPKFLRNYKIQEVIKRRQILLVQVVKEERGNKGAALTTYLSLAGRYCVLMPNSPRGGGISRKITSAADRRRLREITTEMQIPRGMGLIVRTAGAQRPKAEIKRDCEYLLRLWDSIRETTLASTAPALIYEEASLIKRSIRDVYTRDVDEIVVEGDEAYRQAKEFMRMLMPSHARKVQPYRNGGVPLFVREKIENQLDAMHSPTVQLKSGGYLVINQTEALVAIDVNSGRSTRERGIEETALRTNLEAADEVARQLRLRDLAGLIVVDFIDMESARHNAAVERRLKEALKHDRARIQVGRISHFGLLEMSRQRLHPSLTEQAFVTCPHCAGTGLVRTTESAAMQVLRAIEEEGSKRRAAEIVVTCANALALYLLNHKRERLAAIEAAAGMRVLFAVDDSLNPPAHRIDRTRAATPPDAQAAPLPAPAAPPMPIEAEDEPEEEEQEADAVGTEEAPESGAEGENGRRRRRRRRRGGRREDGFEGEAPPPPAGPAVIPPAGPADETVGMPAGEEPQAAPETAGAAGRGEAEAKDDDQEGDGSRRRRGRRGGRRRRREDDTPAAPAAGTAGAAVGDTIAPDAATEPPPPRWTGPTPADPFATAAEYDVFAAMEAAEEAEAAAAAARAVQPRPAPGAEPGTPSTPAAEESRAAAAPEPHPGPPPATEPRAAVATTGTPEPAAPPAAPAAEPAAPALQPIIVSEAPADAPRRRGWWRR